MTLTDFQSKHITTKDDAVSVVSDVLFDEICVYISDESDAKVACLLEGIWLSRNNLSKEQILQSAICTLFPRKGYMRRASSISALMLVQAAGCERELREHVKKRWISISERDCNELALGLSDTKDIAGWIPIISDLFDLNTNNDVRTVLVKAVNNLSRSTKSLEASQLLKELLRRMPLEVNGYANSNNFEFIRKLVDHFDNVK
jgi:hypothetical protein